MIETQTEIERRTVEVDKYINTKHFKHLNKQDRWVREREREREKTTGCNERKKERERAERGEQRGGKSKQNKYDKKNANAWIGESWEVVSRRNVTIESNVG